MINEVLKKDYFHIIFLTIIAVLIIIFFQKGIVPKENYYNIINNLNKIKYELRNLDNQIKLSQSDIGVIQDSVENELSFIFNDLEATDKIVRSNMDKEFIKKWNYYLDYQNKYKQYIQEKLLYENNFDGLKKQFSSDSINLEIDYIIDAVVDYLNNIEQKSKKYFLLVFLLSLCLMVWLLYFILSLKQTNKKIEKTIDELNFQKSALDQHAIVSITDAKGKITYLNKKFEEISGYTLSELKGQSHRVLKSDEHDDLFFKSMWKKISSGKTWQGEVKNRTKDGSFYWVSATIVPFMDEKNKPFQYISIRTDITNRKLIEEELVKAKHEADEANKIKGDFLANMSHELRTPLNGVIGMANIALENEKDKKQKNYLEKINSSANILLQIINDLLDYSKIEAGKLSVEKIEFNLDGLLQNIADLVSVKAYEKDLELVFNRDMNIPRNLYGDPLRISQVLVNILGNAIKFTSEGEVSLNIKLKDMNESKVKLLFEVKDTGIGMDKESVENVFNSFTQADNSISRKYGGTGLGLTITKNLIDLMDGEIKVESQLSVGTTFYIDLEFSYSMQEEDIDYSLTKNLCVYIYKVTSSISKSLVDILSSLKIQYKILDEIPENFEDIEKSVLITEDEACFEYKNRLPILFISNPNKVISVSDDIKQITKPINPSLIYDSILEIVDLNVMMLVSNNKNITKTTKSIKVLLVEDNEINQLVATTFIEGFGCSVKIANNGKEAVDILKEEGSENYDLVFMDVQMPIMNGYEATKIIKTEIDSKLPIIAMTANAMEDDIKKCIEVGMDKHISKPVDKSEIEKAILTFVKRV